MFSPLPLTPMSGSHLGKRTRSSSDEVDHNDAEHRLECSPNLKPQPEAAPTSNPLLTGHDVPVLRQDAASSHAPANVVPASALLPLLDHMSRDDFIMSIAPASPLSRVVGYFYDRVALPSAQPNTVPLLIGVERYHVDKNMTGTTRMSEAEHARNYGITLGEPARHLTVSNMHKFVRCLDVPAHAEHVCRRLLASNSSDKGKATDGGINTIECLRLDLGLKDDGVIALHTDTPNQHCPMLDAVPAPATLVLRGVPCLYGSVPYDLLPREVHNGVRHLTLVLDANIACLSGNLTFEESYMATKKEVSKWDADTTWAALMGGSGLINIVPRTCEQLTIVFDTSHGGTWDPPAHVGVYGVNDSWAGLLFYQIAHALWHLQPRPPRVTFVNAGAIEPSAVLPPGEVEEFIGDMTDDCRFTKTRVQKDLESYFLRMLSKVATEDGWPRNPSKTMLFDFQSMHEWVQSGAWQDVYDECEIHQWMAPSPGAETGTPTAGESADKGNQSTAVTPAPPTVPPQFARFSPASGVRDSKGVAADTGTPTAGESVGKAEQSLAVAAAPRMAPPPPPSPSPSTTVLDEPLGGDAQRTPSGVSSATAGRSRESTPAEGDE